MSKYTGAIACCTSLAAVCCVICCCSSSLRRHRHFGEFWDCDIAERNSCDDAEAAYVARSIYAHCAAELQQREKEINEAEQEIEDEDGT